MPDEKIQLVDPKDGKRIPNEYVTRLLAERAARSGNEDLWMTFYVAARETADFYTAMDEADAALELFLEEVNKT